MARALRETHVFTQQILVEHHHAVLVRTESVDPRDPDSAQKRAETMSVSWFRNA